MPRRAHKPMSKRKTGRTITNQRSFRLSRSKRVSAMKLTWFFRPLKPHREQCLGWFWIRLYCIYTGKLIITALFTLMRLPRCPVEPDSIQQLNTGWPAPQSDHYFILSVATFALAACLTDPNWVWHSKQTFVVSIMPPNEFSSIYNRQA